MMIFAQAALLAADFTDKLNPISNGPGPMTRSVMRDSLIVVGAAVGVAILLFVWAVYFRKPRKHTPGRNVAESRSSGKAELVKTEVVEGSSGRRKSRYRRRRREHRSRNPTLAETGGLPPERPEDS